MRLSRVYLTTACLLWAANTASAQYGPDPGPALLALPSTATPAQYPRTSPTPAPVQPQYAPGPYTAAGYNRGNAGYGNAGYGMTGYAPHDDVWSESEGEPVPAGQAPQSVGPPMADGCNGDYGSPYADAMSSEEGACGAGYGGYGPNGGACGMGGGFGLGGECGAPRPRWYGSLAALIMTRDRANKRWLTYDANTIVDQLQYPPSVDWRGGGEVRIGRYFGCGYTCGLEATYWGLDTMEGYNSARSLGDNMSTPIDVGLVNIGPNAAGGYFDNAREHRIWKYDEIHSLEINFVHLPLICDPSQRLQVSWLAGVRWFRFDDRLIFGSVSGGNEFGSDGGSHEAYLNTRVVNNLIGAQIGARADFWLTQRLRLFARPSIGLYGNDLSHRSHLYSGDGLEGFDIRSTKTDVSMMGQIDLGGAFQITQRWSLYGAYRAVGIAGVALADSQIPFFLADAAEFADIDSNGSVIIHGAVMGAQFNF